LALEKTKKLSWDAQHLRVSFFVGKPVQFTDESWTRITGVPPEVREVRSAIGSDRYAGAFAGAQLVVQNTPLRIDFTIQPVPPVATGVPSFLAGNAEELISLLESKVSLMCEIVGSANRIALAGVQFLEAKDRTNAYELLQNLLKSVSVDPQRMRDLSYGVNWPVVSAGGFELNRLTTWNAAFIRALTTDTSGGQNAVLFEREYVQLSFDMSTAADINHEFPSEEAACLFAELFQLVRENMSGGEILSP
jgi:hypothetical protein